MPVRLLPGAVEHTSDRQTLAMQANSRTTQVVANQLMAAARSLIVPGLATSELSAATTSDVALFVSDGDYTIARAYLFPRGSLTANNTNYATILLAAAGLSGTARRTLGSFTTKATGGQGSWALSQGTAKVFTVLSGARIATGEVLRFMTSKAGTGVQVRECAIQIDLVPR